MAFICDHDHYYSASRSDICNCSDTGSGDSHRNRAVKHNGETEDSALNLAVGTKLILRIITSFCGVFGFSIMFNSSIPMAVTAACIGAVANTLRLELVDYTSTPPAVAAFAGALTAGLLASVKDMIPRL